MRFILILSLIACVVHQIVAPPVNQKKEDEKTDENEVHERDELEGMEYSRYLKEVVQALESDPEFRKKLEKADEVDIRSGKIAQELELVNHQVRTKLDELKRTELERLRHLAIKEYELENGLNTDHLKIAEHLDHQNPHTFEIDDLKKLIAKTTEDLEQVDKQRREAFKEYEMQKQFEKEQKMKGNTGMSEEDKKKYEEEQKTMEEKHKKHKPLHHPGSQQQLEEVWEKQDHMENQDFDPKTFFYLHDLDGNKVWDQNEVKALFLKELDKMYQEGAPEDDLLERAEEMERMREHVFKEADTNHDGLIDYNEFLDQTKKPEFKKDEGWEGLDQQQVYSQQEYEAFEKRRAEEVQKLIAKGMLPPMPDYGHHQQFPPHMGDPSHGMQQQNMHHQGMPQQHQPINNQIPHQQYQQQQGIPPQQAYQHQQPGQYQQPPQYNTPQQQHYQGQVPPVQAQQYHPQQQAYQPQGQVHGQLPPQHQPAQGQQQVYQNQVPQQQMHPGQFQQQQQFQQPSAVPQQQQQQQPIVNQANVQPAQPINTQNAQLANEIPQHVETNQVLGQQAKHVESNAIKT